MRLQIRSRYPSFTKKERAIADYLNEHEESVIYLNVTQCADAAGVSEASVVRFCQKLGLRGYQELKLMLAQQPKSMEAKANTEEMPSLQRSFAAKTMAYQQLVSNTLGLSSEEHLVEAARTLAQARLIHCYGMGASGYTALDAAYQLSRLGLHAAAFIDPHIQASVAANLSQQDVVLGISVSGSTKDLISSLSVAREYNANIIVITNYQRSPAARLADIVLTAALEVGPLDGGSISSKVAQLVLLDLLVVSIIDRLGLQAQDSLRRTANAVLDKLV